jgi:hypothetical protein
MCGRAILDSELEVVCVNLKVRVQWSVCAEREGRALGSQAGPSSQDNRTHARQTRYG